MSVTITVTKTNMSFLGEIQFHELNEPASYPEILSEFAKQNMFILNKKKKCNPKKPRP